MEDIVLSKIEGKKEEREKKREEKEVNDFLQSFDLSPVQKQDIKKYITDLKDPDTAPMFCIRESPLPKEIIQNEYIKDLAKKKFTQTILSKEGLGSGNWLGYIEYFGIEEDFLKQKAFDPYRRKRWLESIRSGQQIDVTSERLESMWGERDKEEEFSKGKFSDIGLYIDMPEVKKAAIAGVLNQLFSGWPGGKDWINTVQEYKNFFKIPEEEFEKNVLEKFREGKIENAEINDRLRKEYSFVENFLNSAEAKEIAKKEAFNAFVQQNESTAENILKYFSLSKESLDQEDLAEKSRNYAIENLKKTIEEERQDLSFYAIERNAKHLTKDDWQKIIEENKNSDKFIGALTGGFKFDWKIEKNVKFFQEIELPEEILKKVGVEVVSEWTSNRDYS
jgi:hypothetical protein